MRWYEKNPKALAEAKRLRANGVSYRALAERFGVTYGTIRFALDLKARADVIAALSVKTPNRRKQIRVAHATYRKTPKGRAKMLLSHARRRARKKGLTLPDFSAEWIIAKIDAGCAISGFPFNFDTPSPGATKNPFAPSLDQITPGAGYAKENVRIILWGLNSALGDFTPEDRRAFAPAWRALSELTE